MAEELSFTERWLMGELLKLSQEIVDFAARTLGADVDQAGQPSIEEEFQLGSRLVQLGTVMQARAGESVASKSGADMNAESSDTVLSSVANESDVKGEREIRELWRTYLVQCKEAVDDWRRVAGLAYLISARLPENISSDAEIRALQTATTRAIDRTHQLTFLFKNITRSARRNE